MFRSDYRFEQCHRQHSRNAEERSVLNSSLKRMPDKLVIDEPYKNSCQKAEQVHHDVRMTGRSYKYQKRQAATQRSSEKVLS
ncbi:MAG: hypothetical protein QNK29_02655 [Desulfobacterales bacterium]|nr:hypothetical protein [Desulfobacterales bacterium]MDX2510910.1 hypothetical protein [Desulfobacterales bacterium]